MTNISVFPESGAPNRPARRPTAGGMTSFRRPPTFIPGIPSCQPLMRPRSGNSIDLAPIPGTVELVAGVVFDSDVMHFDSTAGHGLGAVADHQVLDDEFVGRGAVGKFNLRFRCHGSDASRSRVRVISDWRPTVRHTVGRGRTSRIHRARHPRATSTNWWPRRRSCAPNCSTARSARPRNTNGSARLEIELDQCWDLLRQRRALRETGGDPAKQGCARPTRSRATSADRWPATGRRSDVDVVVVGGGHNGLVAAAYLARAGLRVRLLERQDHVGGAAVSAHGVSRCATPDCRATPIWSACCRRASSSDLGAQRPTGPSAAIRPTRRIPAPGAAPGCWSGPNRQFRRRSARRPTRRGSPSSTAGSGWSPKPLWPTMIEPLLTRAQARDRVLDTGDPDAGTAWEAIIDNPIGHAISGGRQQRSGTRCGRHRCA